LFLCRKITLQSVQEWPDAFTINTERINLKAVFIEDVWDITDNLRLTTGVRYGRYSNFGGEVSPRVGLTWEYVECHDLKLLYGHAFRAPTFYELFNYVTGDPDLDPETTDSYEVSLVADFNSSLSARITGHYGKSKDIITQHPLPPRNFMNFGEGRSRGFEVEMKYDFGRGTYLTGNYHYGSTPIANTPTVDTVNWTTVRHVGKYYGENSIVQIFKLFYKLPF
jgi:outer membrane receptor protein involved in Fe transport